MELSASRRARARSLVARALRNPLLVAAICAGLALLIGMLPGGTIGIAAVAGAAAFAIAGGGSNSVFGQIRRWLAASTGQIPERFAPAARDLPGVADFVRMLDSLPSVIGYWDTNLINRFGNHAYKAWFAIRVPSIAGMHMRDVLGPEHFARVELRVDAVLSGERQSFEFTFEARDGSGPRHALTQYIPDIVDGAVIGFYVQVADISELTEARIGLATALHHSESLIASLDEQFIVSVADVDGHIIEANDPFVRLSGYSREELLGHTHRMINSGTHDAAFWRELWATISAGIAWRGDVCNRAKDGTLYWVQSVIVPIMTPDGTIDRYISIRNDITAAKANEVRLRENEALLDTAGRAAGVGGWQMDVATGAMKWSAETYRIHQIEPDDVIDVFRQAELYPEASRAVIMHAVLAATNDGTSWDFEIPITSGTGRAVWIRAVGKPEYQDGKVVRLVGAIQDITATKAAAAVLAEERQLMTALLDSLPDLVFFKDRDGRFLRVNLSMAHQLGLGDPSEAIGRDGLEFASTADSAKIKAIEQRIIETGEPMLDYEMQVLWPNRPPTWNLVTKMPLRNAAGDIIGTLGVSRDITTSKLDAIKLADSEAILDRAGRAAGVGGWQMDVATGAVMWSAQTYRIHEVDSDYVPNLERQAHLYPVESRETIKHAVLAAISHGTPWDFEIPITSGKGRALWLRAVGTPEYQNGKVVRLVGAVQDITAAKAARQNLRSVAGFLQRSEDVAKVGGWELDLRTRRVTWSAQTRKIHDVDADYQPSISRAGRFFPSGARRAIATAVKACAVAGTPWDLELPFVTATGRALWVHTVGTAEYENGGVVRITAAMQDITERKHTQQRLQTSEAFLERAERVARVGGWEFDLRSRVLHWSPQAYLIHEVEPGYVPIASEAGDFYPPEAFAIVQQSMDAAIRDGTDWDVELPFTTAKGRALWVHAVGTAEFEDGVAVRLIGAIQDITERKQAELQLKSNEAFLDRVGQIAGIGGWEVDLATGALHWSAQTYLIHDREPGSALDLEIGVEDYPLAARDAINSAINDAINHQRNWDLELPLVTGAGRALWVRLVGTVEMRDGTAVRMFGTVQDITLRKRAEIAQRETSDVLQSVLDSVTDVAIIATSLGKGITVFNVGAERMFGFHAADLLGNPIPRESFDPDELRERAAELTAQTGHPVTGLGVITDPSLYGQVREWTLRRKDGSRILVALMLVPIRRDDGNLIGYVVVAQDVTAQRRYEESLRDAMHHAEAANRAKSDFLANMSHEIRTPMNAVLGLSYLLERSSLDDAQVELLHKITTASTSLLSVINDVLDLSKIEAGEMLIEQTMFDPARLLDDIAAVTAVAVGARQIAMTFDIAPDLPAALEGDVTRLRQVLTNLLTNAIKFTEAGGVTLRVRCLATTSSVATLEFAVMDTGIGIATDSLDRLFAPFAQADTSITRRYGGTGLGLSIVKQLVTLMGGTIALESTLGVGSTFTVTLDFALASVEALTLRAEPAIETGLPELRGVRVLLVDDSNINLEVTQRILEIEGAEVEVAHNGLEAVDRLCGGPQDFDVVLMDVQMPVLNGYDATRHIRQDLQLTDLPVIALTASALSSERLRANEAGMNDFIVKPFATRDLVRAIRRLVGTPVIAPATPGPARSQIGATSAPWPRIEGIDTADVRARLGQDSGLFRSLLRRFLEEFADLSTLQTGTPDELAVTAASLHKMLGGAGLLGATAIHQLAREGETACLAGNGVGAAKLLVRLGKQMRQLAASAGPMLTQRALPSALPDAPRLSVAITELLGSLRRQNLAAVAEFATIAPALDQLMTGAAFGLLQSDIDNLRFDAAAGRLKSFELESLASA